MVTLIHGNDAPAIRLFLEEAKIGKVVHVYMWPDLDPNDFFSRIQDEDLFQFHAPACLVVYHASVSSQGQDFMLLAVNKMLKSKHELYFIDKKYPKNFLDQIKKVSGNVVIQEMNKKEARDMTTFSFYEALAKRDKKNSWIIFHKLLQKETPLELVHANLWWTWKHAMLFLQEGKNAKMTPYAQKIAQLALKNYSPQEIKKSAHQLVGMFNTDVRGGDFALEIESFILSL